MDINNLANAATEVSAANVVGALLLSLLPIVLVLLLGGILMGVLCRRLAAHKGYKGYFFMGFFLGLLGLLYVIGLPDLNLRKDLRAVMKRMVAASDRMNAAESGTESRYF